MPTMVGISAIVFFSMAFAPGDPAELSLGDQATPAMVAQLREEWGLNKPLIIQYLNFLKNSLRGDFGRSFRTGRPVVEEIFSRFPATAQLAVGALIVSIFVGIPVGIISAVKRYSIMDNLSMLVALMGVSMPVFWTGIILILFFAHYLNWFPTSGYGTLKHLILPSVTLGMASSAVIARMTRSSMLEVLSQDYIRTAKAKGLRELLIITKHALKNALIPVVTVVGIHVGVLLGGAVVVETVFAWPGVGRLMVTSILARDYALVRAATLLIAAVFVTVNLIVDVLYGFLNPRITYG
jgi:peptide/nickel transport system permease protein